MTGMSIDNRLTARLKLVDENISKTSVGAFEPVGHISPPKRVTPRRVNTALHKGV
jgi:hypothetical protein